MKYKFARLEGDSIKKYEFYSFEQVEKWINEQLEEFKKINKITDEFKDLTYMKYKSQLQNILNISEKIDDYLKCKICLEEDHEDIFCRCENRNIRIAKKKRLLCESPWQNVKRD